MHVTAVKKIGKMKEEEEETGDFHCNSVVGNKNGALSMFLLAQKS